MSENMISKIKIGNIEYELGTTIDNVDGLQNALDSKATESYVNTQIVAVLPEISGQIDTHNVATDSHNDIRLLIDGLQDEINNKSDLRFVAQSEAPDDTSVLWIDMDDDSSDSSDGASITTIPPVTWADNGKFLRVVNGAWEAVTIPYAEEVSI